MQVLSAFECANIIAGIISLFQRTEIFLEAVLDRRPGVCFPSRDGIDGAAQVSVSLSWTFRRVEPISGGHSDFQLAIYQSTFKKANRLAKGIAKDSVIPKSGKS
jgi:hypothetical protein